MKDILQNKTFAALFEKMAVTLNPRRHTAPTERFTLSEWLNERRFGRVNGCSDNEVTLMRNLGLAHDIGKITGTAKPEKSLTVLAQCGVDDLSSWHS